MLIQNGLIVDGINRQVMRGNVFIQKNKIKAINVLKFALPKGGAYIFQTIY